MYRALPLSVPTRLKIKGALFRTFPFLFRRTSTYRAWEAYRRTSERLQVPVPMPPVVRPHADGSLPAWFYADAENEYVPIAQSADIDTRIKAIAFYLPQFHPIPENDRWWGKGFTEWTNVSRGKPQFAGHYQPHLPGELGFYDLRILDVQRRQIELAQDVRAARLLLSLLLVRWQAPAAPAARPVAGEPRHRLPVLPVLGQRELDPPVGRTGKRNPDRAAALARGRPRLHPGHRAGVARSALHPGRRPSAAGRLPAAAAARRAHHGGALARATAARMASAICISSAPTRSTGSTRDSSGSTRRWSSRRTILVRRRAPESVTALNPDFQGTIYDYQYLVEHSRTYQAPASYRALPQRDADVGQRSAPAGPRHASSRTRRRLAIGRCSRTRAATPIGISNPSSRSSSSTPGTNGRKGRISSRTGATATPICRRPQTRCGVSRPYAHRAPIVVVSHDAHFHGAQRMALTLARTLSERLGYDVEILLCGDGPLRPEFERYGRVHDFFSPSRRPRSAGLSSTNCTTAGARIALCNTSVVGSTVELLAEAGFARRLDDSRAAGAHQATWSRELDCVDCRGHADSVVFPAQSRSRSLRGADGPAPDAGGGAAAGSAGPESFQRSTRRRADSCCATSSEPVRIRRSLSAWATRDRRKGLDLFVEAGLALLNSIPRSADGVGGTSEAETLAAAEARIAESGSGDRFLFPGLVEEPDVFFAGADVYLMTSREDPFPLVVLHALDAEIPVIGFEGAGGFVELLSRGCGILVPYLDTAAMAAAANRVLTHHGEREQLAADRTRDHRS